MKEAREGPFAQFNEDRILERIFAGKPRGYCVEVGAYDGRTGSATYLFEKKGWSCLLVEPNPALVEEIRQHRACLIRGCAASAQTGEAIFYVAENVEQMSTLKLTDVHDRLIQQAGGRLREIRVRTATLDQLLYEANFPELDFITIDVEGHEFEVLQGFDLDRHNPRVVIIEDNGGQPRVAEHMARRGYVNFKRTGVNDWYARPSDRALVGPKDVARVRRQKKKQRRRDALRTMLPTGLRERARQRVAGVAKVLEQR